MRGLVLPFTILLGGCPLLDIETDVAEACLTYPDINIGAGGGATKLEQSFAFDDLSGVHDLLDLDADVRFVSVKAHATSGVADLHFVDSAHVSIATDTMAPLDVYDCDGDCVPDGTGITVPAAVQTNALDYLKADSIAVDLAFVGTLPETAWTMDIDLCFSGHAHYAIEP
jgi:hypothetical protein